MIRLRRSGERGYADHGWLRSHHSFSFADYQDPRFTRFGNLRVINEDRIAPGAGFGTHAHRDMEIISYVIAGRLAHRDSMGNVETIPAGDVQRMSAGSGVTHSEYNHSTDETTHFLQIWIEPSQRGITPGYEQKRFTPESRRGRLAPIAAWQDDLADAGALRLHADAVIRAGLFDAGEHAELALDPSRLTYVHIVRGALSVNGHALTGGDAAMLDAETRLDLGGGDDAEVLVFDLAAR